MPTFNTANFAAQVATRANPSRLAAPNVASGDVQFAIIPYTLLGTEAAADVINLCVLPQGVIPVPALSSVTCSSDPGTTLTLDIGTAANPDGLADGIVLSSGGMVHCATATMPAWLDATPVVPDAGAGTAALFATVATAATLTAGVVLHFCIAYKLGRGN
jgi:hypothetical protein